MFSFWQGFECQPLEITLPETNIAPENGWLEYDRFLLGWPIFRGELLVSGRLHKKSSAVTDNNAVM